MPNDRIIKIAVEKLDINQLESAFEEKVVQEGKYCP
jgi:hypothetical protein